MIVAFKDNSQFKTDYYEVYMSRNSRSIKDLKTELDKISGLDGQVGYITESLLPIIKGISNAKIDYKDIKKFRKECERYRRSYEN